MTFGGQRLEHCPQIGTYDPHFAGRSHHATLQIPSQVFDQLKARRQAWPVPYTEEELRAAYLGSDRLFLYVQIAQPKPEMEIGLKIDDTPLPLRKAYSGIASNNSPNRTFVGFR